ncbi:MAG: AMP-binding protein, partial [Actinoallomurus sp.]
VLAIADSYARYCVRPTADDVFAGPAPIPFALGFGFFIVFPLRFGAAAVLTTRKSPEDMLRAVDEHGVTVLFGVSTYFGMLSERLVEHGVSTRTDTLRLLLCGGEPLPERIARQCADTLGLPLRQFLGTTELLHNIVSYLPDESPRPGSFGHAVPGYDVVVRDPVTFKEVPRGESGLLTVRGATGTKYWRKPEQQKEAVREGWCVVKDIVRMDEDGYLYYISRSDEMIISSGFNIAPADVENVLLRHPSVLKVACIGAPDPSGRRSTVVKACVVLRPGYEPSDVLVKELQDFFKANASPNMYPRLVEFLTELPETMTGKVRRSELARRDTQPIARP